MGRWFHASEQQADSSNSSEDEAEDEQEDPPSAAESESEQDEAGPSAGPSTQHQNHKKKIHFSLSGLACHVCGKHGHNAGFVGSVYMDCPNKPCYLCKKPGHTTMTCPYRIAPDHDCTQGASTEHGVLAGLLQRSLDSRQREVRLAFPKWHIDAAVLKLHRKRCTCMQFHPTRDNLAISGDKHGQVAVWDHFKVYERTVWRPNEALTNNLAFLPGNDGMSCCTSSADGTLKVIDIETGLDRLLLNMNPEGWTGNPSKWLMLYGLDVCQPRNLIATGDTRGAVHFVDPRVEKKIASQQLHKSGNKVNSANFSKADPDLLVTGSNDWTARLSDIRKLASSTASPTNPKGKSVAGGPLELACINHPKVVNSAYFSPTTGRKLMTTCIDNRIRIWDYLLGIDKPPDREIVHSHDFNRYLTPFRAEWDPKDHSERLIIIGRYISEDYQGVALHPIDIFDASTGRLLDQLTDPNLMTITPVNKFHPRLDMILSGSSSSLYSWRPTKTGETDGGREWVGTSPADLRSTGSLQGAADFVFYDAGQSASAEKKKRKAAASATEASVEREEEAAATPKGKKAADIQTKAAEKGKSESAGKAKKAGKQAASEKADGSKAKPKSDSKSDKRKGNDKKDEKRKKH